MSKKIWLSLLAAILIALVGGAWLATDAQAQAGGPRDRLRRPRAVTGQVTAITADSLSLDTLKGEALTFGLDERTRFRSRDGGEVTVDDVQVGDWVSVVPVPARRTAAGDAGAPLARAVILLPDDFDPETAKAGRGKVTAVDAAAGRFSLETRAGEELTVMVNAETRFLGQVSALTDLQPGMAAGVAGEQQPGGELLASVVRAGYPRVRRAGEVLAVDAAANQFTLKLRRDGTEITVTVDGDTRFRSKDGAVKALADLQPGMKVALRAQDLGNGAYLALGVLALPE